MAAPGQPQENIAPNNVVDGLALNQKWPSQKSKLQTLTGPSYTAIERELVALKTQIAKRPNADAESLRMAISDAGWFGVLSAVLLSQKGDDPAQRSLLLMQANALVKDLQSRLDRGDALRAQLAGDTDLKKRNQSVRSHSQRLRTRLHRAAALHLQQRCGVEQCAGRECGSPRR
jgi:hypothetical protein